nr:DNA cytosine methyltransferase [Ktedonobacteraceae bacterium]
MRRFRLLSLCSGIGVIDYVWSYVLKQEIAGQIEIDPHCIALLTERFPDVPRRSDIKEVAHEDTPTDFGTIDLMAGGIPCQPFSSAGKRRGTQDDRHLWPYAFALVQRYRPTWVLIENVTGFVNLALDLVCTDLESEGYSTQAFVLPACAIGAPHERQRVFIVAYAASVRPKVSTQTICYACADQFDSSNLLADADGIGECGQEVTVTSRERSQIKSTGFFGREDSTEVAHAHLSGLQIGDGCPSLA